MFKKTFLITSLMICALTRFIYSEANEQVRKKYTLKKQQKERLQEQYKMADPITEEKALKAISDFESQQKNIDDYFKYKEDLESFFKKLDEILGGDVSSPKIIEEALTVCINLFEKHKDQNIKYDGFVIHGNYPAFYYLFLETADTYIRAGEKYRLIRFRIKHSEHYISPEDLTNVQLVFLNEDDFEVFRHFMGNIQAWSKTTGQFEMRERDYKEFNKVKFFTDQDRRSSLEF